MPSLAKVYVPLEKNIELERKELINILTDSILPVVPSSYSKKKINSFLDNQIFGRGLVTDVEFKLKAKETVSAIEEAANICFGEISFREVSFYVLPCFNYFVREKMHGITGYTLSKDIVFLFLDFRKASQKLIKETVAHEINHAIYFSMHECSTLLDSMIFEGLAENFREYVVGGEKALWAKALTRKKAAGLLSSLKDKLDSKDENLYQNVFFNGKEYPLWAGYSMGYYIVKGFFLNHPETKWPEIMKLNSNSILDGSLII